MSDMDDKKERERAQTARLISQALDDQRERWPMMLEILGYEAKSTRAKYLAFVKEGFTEHQAIELCKKP